MIVCDLLVLGAGPAGCAAAIQARRSGLSVVLVESREQPGLMPGETLHPGVEPLFDRLGMGAALRDAGFHRHLGIWVERAGQCSFQPYGGDEAGPWRGFQVDRAVLHGLLQEAAIEAGARLLAGRRAQEVLRAGGQVGGVRLEHEEVHARWTVDATGRRAWLAEQLQLVADLHSPPLRARFGWHDGHAGHAGHADCADGQPRIVFGPDGWDWEAPLGPGRSAWVALRAVGCDQTSQGMDMSWRLRPACAGPGYFLAGDAAAQIDPSSSHGVLRALMSGMYAGHLAAAAAAGRAAPGDVAASYRAWVRSGFLHDVARLREMHQDWLPWPAVSAQQAAAA